MSHYELIFISRPTLTENIIADVLSIIKEYIKSNEGAVGRIEQWGNRPLAYPIQKNKNGYYCLFNFTLNPSLLKGLERKLSLDDNILRYMILNTLTLETDPSVIQNAKNHNTQQHRKSNNY